MRPIIIGAGRGSRLGPRTEEVPKTFVEVMGRPMLDWILDALEGGGFSRRDVVFISGYRAEVVRERHPEFTFVDNRDWASNNILASLMCAREHLAEGFVCTYSDIVYRPAIVRAVVESKHDAVLGCDTDWRRRYRDRSQHPETDGEKLLAEGFDAAKALFEGREFREGRSFERAYLIDLLQWMIERGSEFHRADTHGGYMEIDTLEDLAAASRWWAESAP